MGNEHANYTTSGDDAASVLAFGAAAVVVESNILGNLGIREIIPAASGVGPYLLFRGARVSSLADFENRGIKKQ